MEHVHKYLRVKFGKDKQVFKCVLGCAHYVRKELLVGRKGICWRCNKEVVMTVKNADQKKPHCHDCTRKRKPSTEDVVARVMESLNAQS